MTQSPSGQMTWKSSGQDCTLFLRHSPSDPWRHYGEFPELIKPDMKHMSQGFATFVSLLRCNWESVRSESLRN